MLFRSLILSLLLFPFVVISQELSANDLLDKAIAYHDPFGNWESFSGTLLISSETPEKPSRLSEVQIDLPKQYFYMKAVRDTKTTEYSITADQCEIAFNGETDPSEAIKKENNLSCERANLFKNYYTYLYGLPMKLKDPGTIISEKVLRKKFKGKEYLVLQAGYDEGVGNDVWYFYFNPENYAMEIYQFFKGDPSGKGKDAGEYILLIEETVVEGIKMPKNRAWYYNKDDQYLGTDSIKN
ncbi:DUF6503 family protein [Ulvibacter antarcticus]|uniref:Uncharacterized protein n=1 Tax=Ulvibacter antarcticus TaxID=442714 RepID=A0A3L9Z156_9FLAO|nr:DUF6503 family protein [Ulvibacter antarcticus]RMA66244.1 hypothetical protein BXY75_0664 [Ulvibacter antarcticus]